MEETEKLEVCLYVKKGIECTIAVAQGILQDYLSGEGEIRVKDIAEMHLLKVSFPVLKKSCIEDIDTYQFDEMEKDINKVLKDMEDYAK